MPIAFLAALLAACSGSGSPPAPAERASSDTGTSLPTDTPPTMQDTSATLASPWPTTEPTPSTTPGAFTPFVVYDTALAHFRVEGQATIDLGYTGTESFVMDRVSDGAPLCTWTFDALDWAQIEVDDGPSADHPCTDPDGIPCAFGFDVRRLGGHEAGPGTHCDRFGLVPGAADDFGTAGYGYTWSYQVGGVDYGPTFMYFVDWAALDPTLPPGTTFGWIGLQTYEGVEVAPVESTFDGSTFTYTWDLGTLAYVP